MISATTGASNRLRILLLAEEAAGLELLRALGGSGHEIVAVLTSGGGQETHSPIQQLAQQLGIPCWPADSLRQPVFAERVRAAGIDLLLNAHSLFLIPGDVLGAARWGAFNLHPGPLPEYAGLNAVGWALYRGESTYGVTVHRMAPEVDAGDIAYQESFPVEERDTALSLSIKCVRAGVPLMLKLVETAAADPLAIPAIPQARGLRRYYGKKDIPQRGRLNWSRPARDVVNFARACDYLPFRSPWGHPEGRIDGRTIALVKASRTGKPAAAAPGVVGAAAGRAMLVASADEWVMVHRVLDGGRLVDANGALATGARFQLENGGEQ